MELIELTAKEYNQYFPKTHMVFNSVAFNELNAAKVDTVHYFIFKENKVKLGICLGEKGGVLKSPFSAPFGGFSYNSDEHKFQNVEEAIKLIQNYAKEKKLSIKITLPPAFYGSTIINETVNALYRSEFKIKFIDVNYEFYITDFNNYIEKLESKTRNKLNQSLKNNYSFMKLDSKKEEDVARVYSVIKANREWRGFPLHMSLQSILDTIKLIPADFFILNVDGQDAAAAQCFYVSPSIVRVIYWGDAPGFYEKKVMNLLTYKVFEYYAYCKNVEVLDIGISTEFGEPNHGLCEFKENIGCKTSLQYTFEYSGGGTIVE